MKDFYQILGVTQNATGEEIKTAYRKLATKFHPDKNDGDKYFEERFKDIQIAYNILSDNHSRLEYDRKLQDYSEMRDTQQYAKSSAATSYSSKNYKKEGPPNNKSDNKLNNSTKNSGCGTILAFIFSFLFFWFLWKQCSKKDNSQLNENSFLNDSAAYINNSAVSDSEQMSNKVLPIAGVVSAKNNNVSNINRTKKVTSNKSNKKKSYSATAKTSYKKNRYKRATRIRNTPSNYQSSGYCGHPNKTGGNCKRRVKGGGYCWQHS